MTQLAQNILMKAHHMLFQSASFKGQDFQTVFV